MKLGDTGLGRVKQRPTRPESYTAANRECAKVILADPQRYPPDSLPGIWARMVIGDHRERAPKDWRLVA